MEGQAQSPKGNICSLTFGAALALGCRIGHLDLLLEILIIFMPISGSLAGGEVVPSVSAVFVYSKEVCKEGLREGK